MQEVLKLYEYLSKLKNKKGASTIEIVIGVLIFILILGFMLDIIVLTWKFNVVSQTNTQIARIAGIQGGVRSAAPSGWPGGYTTIRTLDGLVMDKMSSAGIESEEWEGSIGNGRIGRNGVSQTEEYDYKTNFETTLTIEYTWEFLSMMLPGSFTQEIESRRPAMSEWKYNYDSWEGE
jgi:hypothetical protein